VSKVNFSAIGMVLFLLFIATAQNVFAIDSNDTKTCAKTAGNLLDYLRSPLSTVDGIKKFCQPEMRDFFGNEIPKNEFYREVKKRAKLKWYISGGEIRGDVIVITVVNPKYKNQAVRCLCLYFGQTNSQWKIQGVIVRMADDMEYSYGYL